jgi:hypothetical protein
MTKKPLGAAFLAVVLLGCHVITEELPTRPDQNPTSPVVTISIPVFTVPTPVPTPRPSATPGPNPTATPGPVPTPEPEPGTCVNPTPGPLAKIDLKVHIYGANRIILDTTPLVGPDAEYCRKIGFSDGRRYCPPRPEGHLERFACDGVLMGKADDTGRIGPTWSVNGQPCVYEYGCENHPDNQFLSFAYKKATYEACAESGVCGSFTVQ